MNKVERILEMITEKSRGLQEEYSDLVEAEADREDLAETGGAINLLDEVYKEVKLIQKQDD